MLESCGKNTKVMVIKKEPNGSFKLNKIVIDYSLTPNLNRPVTFPDNPHEVSSAEATFNPQPISVPM